MSERYNIETQSWVSGYADLGAVSRLELLNYEAIVRLLLIGSLNLKITVRLLMRGSLAT